VLAKDSGGETPMEREEKVGKLIFFLLPRRLCILARILFIPFEASLDVVGVSKYIDFTKWRAVTSLRTCRVVM
jgi:hypothetical protein